jgi:hypothetical protein
MLTDPKLRSQVDALRDKLLVILSENSIASEWIGDEVEAALELVCGEATPGSFCKA